MPRTESSSDLRQCVNRPAALSAKAGKGWGFLLCPSGQSSGLAALLRQEVSHCLPSLQETICKVIFKPEDKWTSSAPGWLRLLGLELQLLWPAPVKALG